MIQISTKPSNICCFIAYDQIILRTMFFERCSDTGIFIVDGIKYDVSNAANIDHFNCKQAVCFLWGTQL